MAHELAQFCAEHPDALDQAHAVLQLLQRTDKADPDPADLATLTRLLADLPALARILPDLAGHAQAALVDYAAPNPGRAALIQAQCDDLRAQLVDPQTGPVEQLLVDAVVQAWLLYHTITLRYTAAMDTNRLTLAQSRWWEDRLLAAQRRFLRALESLARTRRLLRRQPNLQLNIAAGGQQLNVAGDLLPDRPSHVPAP